MFSHYETYDEAYNVFLKNQESDTKVYKFCFCVAMAIFAASAYFEDYSYVLALFGGAASIQGIIYFIDMSNRNTMLHLMDYMKFAEWRRLPHGAKPGDDGELLREQDEK